MLSPERERQRATAGGQRSRATCPAAEVTVTSVLPVNGLPSFTAKLTVTFSGFRFRSRAGDGCGC